MKTSPHYVDAGHDAPDPGSPQNRRILALLEGAVARADGAIRSLDAVDAVLEEQRQRDGKRVA